MKSITVEGLGFYRVATGGRGDKPALDVLVGVRYYVMSSRPTPPFPAAASPSVTRRTSTGWTPSTSVMSEEE